MEMPHSMARPFIHASEHAERLNRFGVPLVIAFPKRGMSALRPETIAEQLK